MFDDPKKELRELEGQLLAAELNHRTAKLSDDQFEELYDGILEEFGPKESSDGTSVSTQEPPIRNFANGYGKTDHSRPLGSDGDMLLDDSQPAAPRKGIKGLVALACLECLAIAGVAVYWFYNFL